MTAIRGHMTAYEGLCVLQSLRRQYAHPRAPGTSPAERELRPRARSFARIQSFRHPEGASIARTGRSGGGARGGTDAPVSPQSTRGCPQGIGGLSGWIAGDRDGPSHAHRATAAPAEAERQAALKITQRSALADVAIVVGDALRRAGIRGVLTGGACAHLYSAG